MEHKIKISKKGTNSEKIEPLPLTFNNLYKEFDSYLLNLEKLINRETTNRPIAYLNRDELKKLPLIEKELIESYNSLYDDNVLDEESIAELNQITDAVYNQKFNDFGLVLTNNINSEVDRLLYDNNLDTDSLYNFEVHGKYNNFTYNKMKDMLISNIRKAEFSKVENKKDDIKILIKKYFTARCITFMDNNKLINSPGKEVW